MKHNVDLGTQNVDQVDGYYGDVVAVFKNDIKDRSVLFLADSLNHFNRVIQDIEDPPFPEDKITKLAELNQMILGMSQSFERGRLFKSEGNDALETFEAHVWGPLSLEDVTHLLVTSESAYKKLPKDLGIPVYLLEKRKIHKRWVYFAGKKLN